MKDDNKSTLFLSNMSIHHETYARAAKDKRRESLHTRCNEQVNEIQSKINDLKINNPAANSKLTSLELRKQALTFRQSSQEAVEAIVLNPPVPKLPFQCDKCQKSLCTQFGLSVHLRWHNKNLNLD